MSFQEDIQIDKSRLDEEWLQQPTLLFKYSEQLAGAEKNLDLIELKRDTIIAELTADSADETGLTSEYKIKQWINRQPTYQEVQREKIEAKYQLNILRGVVRAFEHRKKSLENMVSLFLSNYYAESFNPVKAELVSAGIHEKLEKSPRLQARKTQKEK